MALSLIQSITAEIGTQISEICYLFSIPKLEWCIFQCFLHHTSAPPSNGRPAYFQKGALAWKSMEGESTNPHKNLLLSKENVVDSWILFLMQSC